MHSPRLLFVSFSFLLFSVSAARAQEACPSSIRIISPGPNQVVSSQEDVKIDAATTPALDLILSAHVQVSADISAQGLGFTFPIAAGDLRSNDSPSAIEGLWNISQVHPGTYTITVILQMTIPSGPCRPVQDSVRVVVNGAPTLHELQITGCQAGLNGRTISLRAITSDPDGDAMTEFLWAAGDGSATQTIQGSNGFTHTYPPGTGVVRLWVTGYDDRGGMFIEERDLDVFNCAVVIPRLRLCGCDSMAITATAGQESQIYCGPGLPPAAVGCNLVENPPAGACGPNQVAFRCALGPLLAATPDAVNRLATARRLGWTFDAVAKLNPASNDPNTCDEGQFVRSTIAVQPNGMPLRIALNPQAMNQPPQDVYMFPNGGNFSVLAAPNRVPAFDAPNTGAGNMRFGSDDYRDQTNLFKRHRDGEKDADGRGSRQWNDQVAVDFDSARTMLLQEQNEFVSFVRGNLGTCWCQFRFQQQWVPNERQAIGGGRAPQNLEMVAGNSCTVR